MKIDHNIFNAKMDTIEIVLFVLYCQIILWPLFTYIHLSAQLLIVVDITANTTAFTCFRACEVEPVACASFCCTTGTFFTATTECKL